MSSSIKSIDTALFRGLMRKLASSVTVITTCLDKHLHGMTATAVSSVSADPPTILIVVNKDNRSHPLIRESRSFVVNVLADTQRMISERFSGKLEYQFDGLDYRLGQQGSPILSGVAAHLECVTQSETQVGTHTIFIGRVVDGGVTSSDPLLYHDGAYKAVSPRVSAFPIAPMFLERWSPRSFTDEDICIETLMSCFEAARWAPSSLNAQPWRFIYALRNDAIFHEILQTLSSTNRSWAQGAAALIVFVSKETMSFEGREFPSPTHSFDAGAAWMSLALQANILGWHTHGMAGFEPEVLRSVLGVPDGFLINAVTAIGKLGDRTRLPEKLRDREVPSTRDQIALLVSHGRFRDNWT
ncbi:MAG: flavin reductase [Alphaproteobacteria bacterium]|nr:flavin reductase [Alphaproteobacteria bacterium]